MTPGNALPDGAVVDSSAIMSILDKRLSARAFREALEKTRPLFMGAPTYVELSVVVLGKKNAAGSSRVMNCWQHSAYKSSLSLLPWPNMPRRDARLSAKGATLPA